MGRSPVIAWRGYNARMVRQKPGTVQERTIAVALSLLQHHHRAIVAGVVRYAATKGNWRIATTEPIGLPVFSADRAEEFDGIITGLHAAPWEKRVPTVYVGTPWPQKPGPTVCVDNGAVGTLAAEHLMSLGVEHFAFVGVAGHIWSHQRRVAFEQALATKGHSCVAYHIAQLGAIPTGEAHDAFCRWLQDMPRPCGLFGADDSLAAAAAAMTRHAGLLVPRDVAIIGANNDDVCCLAVAPALSSVAIPADEVGYEAARWLDRAMGGQSLPVATLTMIVPSTVVQRGSTQMLDFDDPIVCEAIRLIRSRAPHEMISTKQIAADLRIGRRQLDRMFTAAVGTSPKEEIDRVRGERLRELLARRDYPLKRIVHEMGFVGWPELSRFCRRVLDASPTAVREQLGSVPQRRR